eukprot:snap_masked-scaffold_3-processed-gene-11.18-mRNA-1 protein AED:1.00 eAED:1.00 QI:0/-1/0/0/-1/1/1/0/78
MSVAIHFSKGLTRSGKLKVIFIEREFNIADLQTKQNPRAEFEKLWNMTHLRMKWQHLKIKEHHMDSDTKQSRVRLSPY